MPLSAASPSWPSWTREAPTGARDFVIDLAGGCATRLPIIGLADKCRSLSWLRSRSGRSWRFAVSPVMGLASASAVVGDQCRRGMHHGDPARLRFLGTAVASWPA